MVLLGFPGYLGHHQDFWILGVRERRINKRVLRGTKVENLRMDPDAALEILQPGGVILSKERWNQICIIEQSLWQLVD